MPKTSDNLRQAQRNKADEFYTLEEDIAEEVKHYFGSLKGRIVYLPCDGSDSAFVSYFKKMYRELELQGLYWSYHNIQDSTLDYHGYYNGSEEQITEDFADFRTSKYSSAILQKCDVVITNPPFSLLKTFIPWILQAGKKLLVMGNINASCNKNIFPLLRDQVLSKGFRDKAWNFKYSPFYINYSAGMSGSDDLINMGGIIWYTNLKADDELPLLELTEEYSAEKYPMLDNYSAININRTKNIPKGYKGLMAVPVSFMLKYNPKQFEIVDCLPVPILKGKNLYNRLIIRSREAL